MPVGRGNRRAFIAALGGAVAWPLVARAQQAERMRRIGVLMNLPAGDPQAAPRVAAFQEALRELGWNIGQNIQMDLRWASGSGLDNRKHAAELIAQAPDVVLAYTTFTLGPLLELTHTIPIVFVNATDPVGGGYIESLARPGGNATGFTAFEYSTSGKWLELLREVAPRTTRVAVLRDPTVAAGIGQFGAIQALATMLGVELHPLDVRDAGEIERTINAFAQGANGGLIVTGSVWASIHRKLIITLAAQHKLPAVYNSSHYATDGGLISYGSDILQQFRSAAGYVDRILKGEKAADLPVQAPTKYELVINLKTAKAIGLTVPPTLLARADEVIE
jgi:putative ABC transport system substrate-binding protein